MSLALRVESRIKALARDRKERLIRQEKLFGAILAEAGNVAAARSTPRGLIARGRQSKMTVRHG